MLGLFILAAGLPCLETVCNPYATVLGPPESGTARINLAQSVNSIGWMIGPVLGDYFVLSATGEPITNNATLYQPYLIIAVAVGLLIVAFAVCKVPDLHNIDESKVEVATGKQLARLNRAFLGDIYPPSLLTRSPHLHRPLFRITDRGTSLLLAFGGFLFFLIGRIIGSFGLRIFRADLMLAVYSAANIVMMILTMNTWGWFSVAGL